MKDWEVFEINSTEFLNEYFKDNNVDFVGEGSSDSTISDIEMYQSEKLIGTIEAKYIPSQSGQIVVLSDDTKFIFSEGSKNKINDYTKSIISYINNNFQSYKDVKTKGLPINIGEETLFNWVKEIYKDKNVSWVISSNTFNNLAKDRLLLIPLDEIENYFNISAVLRRKKSGPSHLPVSDKDLFITELEDIITKNDYTITKVRIKNEGRYLLKLNVILGSEYIGERYFLSPTSTQNEFYVKKRSKTNNPNIVFSLTYKNGLDFKDKEFKEYFHL